MTVCVTGAAGFIGSTLVDRLIADGHAVLAVDDLSRGRRANLRAAEETGRCRFAAVDVTTEALPQLLVRERPEAVLHLAAQVDVRFSVADPLADARTNVLGTVNVLEAARLAGVRKVVFTSSGGSIYGEPADLPVGEEQPLDPHSPYAAGKAAGELYLTCYRRLYGLEVTSLALGNVYGPRQDPHGEAGVVAIFATALLAGRPATIYGDGTATRDYVYVADVADAFARALGPAGDGRRYNIGTGVATSVRELHALVAAAAPAPDEPRFAPPRLGELQAIALDSAAARRELGWQPRTGLADGVRATVAWVRGEVSPAGAPAGD